jgi:hypothetical protein
VAARAPFGLVQKEVNMYWMYGFRWEWMLLGGPLMLIFWE